MILQELIVLTSEEPLLRGSSHMVRKNTYLTLYRFNTEHDNFHPNCQFEITWFLSNGEVYDDAFLLDYDAVEDYLNNLRNAGFVICVRIKTANDYYDSHWYPCILETDSEITSQLREDIMKDLY